MNKSIEQSLTGLIPSLSGPLPPELVNLGQSLLAQSRSKASTLKPEEEIARPYACAQLACERLKQRLNLPSIISRPPCPPQAYKKLYAYLSTALPDRPNRSAPSTPRKSQANALLRQTPTKPRTPSAPHRETPSKRDRSALQSGHIASSKGTQYKEAPEWVMPTIRHLCKAFSSPAAAPHVFAGVCSVLALHKSSQSSTAAHLRASTRSRRSAAGSTLAQSGLEPITESRMPGLIATIVFYTLARMANKETTPDQYLEQRDKAISTLRELEVGKDRDEESIQADIEHFMREAQAEGWLKMEWFLNVAAGWLADDAGNGEDGEQVDVEGYNEDEDSAVRRLSRRRRRNNSEVLGEADGNNRGLQIGLGTMMQDKVDYLSEDRQLDYLEWRAGIMARIERIEREQAENGGGDDMDTT
ncbi:hypothetical protein AOQ84DRAFT_429074 [Glonium stellatum]|uniref:ORC6 first cyclin-like domain-containing protein n=1 Tax=Glonium stellatum TaxID=574774 RepID=A0A8E2FBH5_9PEZI|nr:hypothetical protein AOQ84DRAFT_429074 [Glonium stellatum]